MYVASSLDKSWLRNAQRTLYARSRNEPNYVWCKLWGLVTDRRNLRLALVRVSQNKGARTAGVDGRTVRAVLQQGPEAFIEQLRADLRSGSFRPSAARRVLIPKAGQPGKFRPLGIPTVRDRVVQAAMKNILEPIFEADFYPVSYGFRPGKSVHNALEHMRVLLRPRKAGPNAERRLPYQWAIEGDIKGCFDNIDHHGLMMRVRRRVDDAKTNRLVVAFLKAGVLSEGQFFRSGAGTPQGGILTPPTQVQISNGGAEFRESRCEHEHPINAGDRDERRDIGAIFRRFLDSFRLPRQGRVPDATLAAHSGRVFAVATLDAASAQRL
jgi:retron-type reverse transcriptase